MFKNKQRFSLGIQNRLHASHIADDVKNILA